MSVIKYILWPFSFIYGSVVRLRNYLYDTGFFGTATFDVPIIAIGNLNMGGSGKTILTSYLIELLSNNYALGILSRGYGRSTNGYRMVAPESNYHDVGDEPKLLALKYPFIPVAVHEQRILGIPAMYGQYPFLRTIILDDALQHRAVTPHISILLTNHDAPYWEDHVLPMGNLRESKAGAARANIIIVNKCPKRLGRIEMDTIVAKINPTSTQKVFFSVLLYSYPYNIQSPQQKLVIDKQTAILAITGIAEPIPLIRHLQKFTEHLYWQRYSDHHKFNKEEVTHLINYYQSIPLEKKYILTTEKDAVRLSEYLSEFEDNDIKIYAVPVQMTFLQYKEDFNQFISEYFNYYYPPPPQEEDFQATEIS